MKGSKRRFIIIACGALAVVCFAFVLWIRVATTTVRGPVVSAHPCQYRTGNNTTGSLLSGTDVTIRSSDDGRLYRLGCSAQSYPLGTSVAYSMSPLPGFFPSDGLLSLLTIAGILFLFVGALVRAAKPKHEANMNNGQSSEQSD